MCQSQIVHDMTQLGTRDKSHRKFGMVKGFTRSSGDPVLVMLVI